MLELENQTKKQGIETEKMVQEAVVLKAEAERQIHTGERMKLEADVKLQEAQKLFAKAEKDCTTAGPSYVNSKLET